MRRLLVRFCVFSCVVFVTCVLMFGQADTSIRGTVTDPSGASIPNAQVTVANTATGLERHTATSSSGEYELLQIPPGPYRLTVEAQGFKKYEATNVQLQVNSPATVNVALEIGGTSETVAVTGETPLLNTVNASIGAVMTENQVKELPIEGRDVASLYSLQPGVVFLGNNPNMDQDTDTRSGAVNGARSDQSNIMLDGVDANDQTRGYAFNSVLRMTPDSIQEFRVATTNYDAESGRSSGAEITIVTKSGTNSFHGDVFEFLYLNTPGFQDFGRKPFGLDRLVLAGQVTEQCVLYSALDAYVRTDESQVELLPDFDTRFPAAPPSLVACQRLRVRGDVRFEGELIDDLVLLRSDGNPTYHLSVVVDDIDMEITHVARGDDHLSNTPKHILLFRAFGADPPAFAHLPLILGSDRKRLSKRTGATSVEEYRDIGILPEALFNFLTLLGWSPGGDRELFSKEEATALFDLSDVNKAPAVFDVEKLLWMNGQYLMRTPTEKLYEHLTPFLPDAPPLHEMRAILELHKPRARTLRAWLV